MVVSVRTSLISSNFIVKSPGSNFEAVIGLTIPEYIWKDLHLKENSPALECAETGKILTHGDVHRQSKSFAAALLEFGFKRREVVAVILPNLPEYAVVLFGVWEAGGIVSSINPSYTPTEMIRQLVSSEAKYIVTIPQFLPVATIVQNNYNMQKTTIITIGEQEEGCKSYEDMLTKDSSGIDFLSGSQIDTKEEVAILPFSSGTTGLPKGVEITHSNLCSNLAQIEDSVLSRRTDDKTERMLLVPPFFHSYGLIMLLSNQMLGSHSLCIPKFSPTIFAKHLRNFKPTLLPLVPPLVSFIAKSPDITKEDLNSVDCIEVAGAPTSPTIRDEFLKKAEKFVFVQELFGLTETSPCVMAMNRSFANTKLGSCGTPISGTLGKVIDICTGQNLGPRSRGEVCVKGPQLMKGYYRNKEATTEAIDSDGWFHTGDIGYFDGDGCFYIVDRIKELIKVNALQVSPAELEDEIRKLPDVVDVAVIGVPNERFGELPRAYIVRKSQVLTESKVNEFLNGKVSKHKELKGGIEFVDEIPRAQSGKILRRELKANYLAKLGEKYMLEN